MKIDKLGNKGKKRLVAKWRHGVKEAFCCYCTYHHCTVRNRLEYVTKKPIEKEREKLKIQETKKKSKRYKGGDRGFGGKD